jgi:hypothetical protein
MLVRAIYTNLFGDLASVATKPASDGLEHPGSATLVIGQWPEQQSLNYASYAHLERLRPQLKRLRPMRRLNKTHRTIWCAGPSGWAAYLSGNKNLQEFD